MGWVMIVQGKLQVSQRGLLQRINRHLAEQETGLVVKKDRTFAKPQVDVYYVLDTKAGRIVKHNVNLEEFARELDVFKSWEVLVKEVNH